MEIKEQVDSLAKAWEEFKSANDARLKEIEKKGAADPLITGQIEKINGFMDEAKSKLDKLETAVSRPGAGSDNPEEKAKADELEHKKAFENFLRKGDESSLGDLQKKAMSVGSDPDGGYLVTPAMSSTINQKVFETSPIRAVASVISISTDSLDMMDDVNEASSGWVSETGSRPETNTPQIGKRNITTHEVYAEPRATQKLLDDASVNVEAWLGAKIADKFSRDENTAFVSGNGTSRPRGFLTYSAGTTWGTIEQIASGSSAVVTADSLINLQGALKELYQGGAVFMMKRSVLTAVRLLKTGDGQYLWQPGLQAGVADSLLGKPVYMADDMQAAASNSLSIAYGNFKVGYQIVDRKGITILRDPYTAKPFVKFYATKRVGGDVINFEAIKLLKLGA
jgi:HK97 family phage major capsid protein